MSHVDEGLLHAWIDGAFEPGDPEAAAIEAHLNACAECRASADAARQLKEKAARVLLQAAPDAVRVEPFDRMIRARTADQSGSDAAEADAPAGVAPLRPRRRMQIPLAWAASIMMAVTAGWFANTMLRPDRSSGPAESAFDPLSIQAPDPEANAQAELQERANEADAVADAAAVRSEEARQVPRRATEDVDASGERREAALGRTAPAAASPPAQKALGSAAVRDSLAATVAEAEQMAAVSADQQLLESATSIEWSTVTAAEAVLRFGRMPFAIEGVPIESIELADTSGVVMVRVRQRIEPDAAVEIVQQMASIALDEVVVSTAMRDDTAIARNQANRARAIDSTSARALAAQRNRAAARPLAEALESLVQGDTTAVRVPMIGYTILIRGALPADSLRALGNRVR